MRTGVFVPNITPFTRDGEVDENRLREVIDYHLDSGVHGLIPCGSSGQGPSLLHEEKKKVIKIVVDQVNGRVPVFAGTGCVSTRETILLSKYAEDVGADGLMIIPPYYNVLDEAELRAHYGAIAASVNIKIMAYNNPATSKIDLKPQLISKLAEDSSIAFVKESSGAAQRVREILDSSRGKLSVFCGMDNLPIESFSLGAVGWVSGTGNIVPAECVQIYELAVMQRKYDEARAVYERIRPICEAVEHGGKFAQFLMYGASLALGKEVGDPRLPLLPMSDEEKKDLIAMLQKVTNRESS